MDIDGNAIAAGKSHVLFIPLNDKDECLRHFPSGIDFESIAVDVDGTTVLLNKEVMYIYDKNGNLITGVYLPVKLYSPRGITFGADDSTIFVADNGLGQILEFDRKGYFINSFPVDSPFGICVDPTNGDLVVSSNNSSAQISRFDKNGNLIQRFPSPQSPPLGIYVDEEGTIIFAEYFRKVLQIRDRFGNFHTPIQLPDNPLYVAVTPQGKIVVSSNDGVSLLVLSTNVPQIPAKDSLLSLDLNSREVGF